MVREQIAGLRTNENQRYDLGVPTPRQDLFRGKKVFVLDSCRVTACALKHGLGDHKCEVQTGTSSATALMRIVHWHPDVLITSAVLGELSGFDLCVIFKLMPDYASMPILLVSSDDSELAQRKAADVGADYYLPRGTGLVAGVLDILGRLFGAEAVGHDSEHPVQRVLVVDDSRVMRRLIRNLLKAMGLTEIVEAGNGLQALDVLSRHQVDLIMTDWNMPEMNGLEFTRAVRRDVRFKRIPMVMVTTEGGRREMAEAEAAGINAHLCKPFTQHDLRTIVNRFASPPNPHVTR